MVSHLSSCRRIYRQKLSEVADILPISFMTLFFVEAHMRSTQQEDDENVDRVEALQRLFPGSTYLITAKALNFHAMMREQQRTESDKSELPL